MLKYTYRNCPVFGGDFSAEGLVRDNGDNFRKLLWKVANYLAKEEKGK